MKILLTSDIKGQKNEFELIKANEQYDIHFDLGNSQFDLEYIARNSIITIKGTDDNNQEAMEKRLIDLLNYTVYLTNGVKENVALGLEMLEQKATEYKANLVIFPANIAACYKKDERIYIAVPKFFDTKKYLLLDLNEEDEFNPIDDVVEKKLDII